ncbi:hypothetical protein AVEN_14639-1 [Araneus ventricosus]|uniref:RNase H type-1 domain-containing protein n=1 Tax=Araneus ventricosus TaxID=182803 RepID=A0A4Y2KWW2_ARAVE|nr:hypothetical protein AVEN_14639-1 [Araneus ventricosus]
MAQPLPQEEIPSSEKRRFSIISLFYPLGKRESAYLSSGFSIPPLGVLQWESMLRFEVYTDGSKSNSEAGFAVCILEHREPYEIFNFKLGVNNTVFQAELAAIDFAVCWDLKKKIKINIITDSQSSIEALRSSMSSMVIKSKENFNLVGGQIGLSWVKTHAGNPGSDLADHHTKLATTQGVEMHCLFPIRV